jgi:hypothetical protein
MKRAEFEEREFETPLYNQLRAGKNHVWSPGQVLEQHVGFDYSLLCVDSYFWALHGLQSYPGGFILEELRHIEFWKRRSINRALPNFSLNLFLQAKRPEVRTRLPKVLKNQSISAPYWRFSIEPNQQRVLEALAKATKGKSLVCYATPAFDRLNQLYAHTKNGSLVSNSSFPEADWLIDHNAWNYDKPGAIGIANPDPSRKEGSELPERIDQLRKANADVQTIGYETNLRTLAAAVSGVAEEVATQSEGRSNLYVLQKAEVDEYIARLSLPRYNEPIKDYLKILAFLETFKLQWHVLNEKPSG